MMTLDQLLYHEKQRKQPKIIVKYEDIEPLDQSGIQWEEDTLFHYAKTKDKEISAYIFNFKNVFNHHAIILKRIKCNLLT